jgi:hypothetical protein
MNNSKRFTDKHICGEIESTYITDGGKPPSIEELASVMAMAIPRVRIAVQKAHNRGKLECSLSGNHLMIAR